MKKIVLLVVTLLAFTASNAQESTKKVVKAKFVTKIKPVAKTKFPVAKSNLSTVIKSSVEGAGIVFESETIDYGSIEQNADGAREFVLTNNGNKPLIITNAQGSCGCTVPTWPKDPIAPGAKAVIGVKYATERVGAISKSITITSNAVGKETKVIFIKGNVNAAAVPTVVPSTIAPKT